MEQAGDRTPGRVQTKTYKTMTKNYLLTSSRFKGQILFKYHLNGGLEAFEIQAELTEVQRTWLYHNFPLIDADLMHIAKAKGSTMKVVEVPADLSFEKFWKTYRHKVGKLERAKKLWEALPEAEKVSALNYIPTYDLFLDKTLINKCYPETYLSQKRWNND